MTQGQTSELELRRVTRSARRRAVASVRPTVLAREFTPPAEETSLEPRIGEVVIPIVETQVVAEQPDSDTATDSGSEEAAIPPAAILVAAGVAMAAVRAPYTRLKYNRFKGDGEIDVDDWLDEFIATAHANQEDAASRLCVFAGLLKVEALNWYLDLPAAVKADWDDLTEAFVRTFREVGGEARALGRLSQMTKNKGESVR